MSMYEVDPENITADAPDAERPRCNSWEELAQTYGSTIEEYIERHLDAVEPISTGIDELDRVLSGGLRPGVTVLGGEPGAGKSAFALQLVLRHLIPGKKAVYVTLEMDHDQCMTRILSNLSAMSMTKLQPFTWSDAWRVGKASQIKLDAAGSSAGTRADIMRDLENGGDPVITAAKMFEARYQDKLIIVDSPLMQDITTLADLAQDAESNGATLFVVDYLQFMDEYDENGRSIFQNEYERISSVVRDLSYLGHDLDMPILALSSTSRSGDKESAGMHGFKGSGDIEFCAEVAMMLRKAKDAKDNDKPDRCGARPVILDVAKNRRGALAKLEFYFDGAHNTFLTVDEIKKLERDHD